MMKTIIINFFKRCIYLRDTISGGFFKVGAGCLAAACLAGCAFVGYKIAFYVIIFIITLIFNRGGEMIFKISKRNFFINFLFHFITIIFVPIISAGIMEGFDLIKQHNTVHAYFGADENVEGNNNVNNGKNEISGSKNSEDNQSDILSSIKDTAKEIGGLVVDTLKDKWKNTDPITSAAITAATTAGSKAAANSAGLPLLQKTSVIMGASLTAGSAAMIVGNGARALNRSLENGHTNRELELQERNSALNNRELELQQRNSALNNRELELQVKQNELREAESKLNKKIEESSPTDSNFIQSTVEPNELDNPLFDVLESILLINCSELILLFVIIILSFNFRMRILFTDWLIRKIPSRFTKTISLLKLYGELNDKFLLIYFMFIAIIVILLKFFSIFVTYTVIKNLDGLILNSINNKSIILLLLNQNFFCKNNPIINNKVNYIIYSTKSFSKKNIGKSYEYIIKQKSGILACFSNKTFYNLLSIFFLNFVFLLLLSIFINWEIMNNIDLYVNNHNDLLKKSILIFLSTSSSLFKTHVFISPFKRISIKCKSTFSKNNLKKVSNFIENEENKSIVSESFLSLIKENKKNFTYLPEYVLFKSFKNVNFINLNENVGIPSFLTEENCSLTYLKERNEQYLDKEYGVYNMIGYKLGFEEILQGLEEKKIYKLLFRWKSYSISNGVSNVNFNTSPSFFIYKEIDIDILLYKFSTNLSVFENKYGFSGEISLDIFIKKWIDEKDFKTFNKILDKIKEIDSKKSNKNLPSLLKIGKPEVILNKKSFFKNDFYHLEKVSLAFIIKGDEYGKLLSKNEIIENNLDVKLQLNLDSDILYKFTSKNQKQFYVKVLKLDPITFKVLVYTENLFNGKIQTELDSWTDTILKNEGGFFIKRVTESGLSVYFKNNKVEKVEKLYNSKALLQAYRDFDKDTNIGVIDIETYLNENNENIPYAIGYKTNKETKLFYLDSYLNPNDMLLSFIQDLLIKENHNYKFYAHNMGEFDGILILKSLMVLGENFDFSYDLKSNKEGKIISLEIKKKIKHKKIIKITILDSFLLLPFSLEKLGQVFNFEEGKGIFPYSFVQNFNINYKGKVPALQYFDGLDLKKYLNYCESFKGDWDCKQETLKYLNKDLDLLYFIMHEFNNKIFKEFNINITRIRTVSGLALLIFTANFYNPEKGPIYFTDGKVEAFIRNAYYGGIVDINVNYTDYTTYKYDVNSHYPNAMLNPMPGGKPFISSEKDLDKIFGFVEAKVQAPNVDVLKIPILPVKLQGKTQLFRGTVEGFWFSEELKMARDYGYKILEINSCIMFEKKEGIFHEFVKTIYDKKLNSVENEVNRLTYKLILNNLYGRLGILGDINELKLIKDDFKGNKISKMLTTQNSDILYRANNHFLIKTQGPLDPELSFLINEEKLYKKEDNGFNQKNPFKGISSSVQYSAAITAYGRMFLNKFKNLPYNNYIGGDTDSIILSKPLDNMLIGDKLGLFKLEHVISEGFYLEKKFYMLITKDNVIIFKAKGINNNLLNYNTFIELFKGYNVTFKIKNLTRDFKTLEVKCLIINKTIKGLKNKEINWKIKNRAIIKREENFSLVPFIKKPKK